MRIFAFTNPIQRIEFSLSVIKYRNVRCWTVNWQLGPPDFPVYLVLRSCPYMPNRFSIHTCGRPRTLGDVNGPASDVPGVESNK